MPLPARQLSTALAHTAGRAHDLTERIASELAFAEELCRLHPDSAETWQPLIAEAEAVVAEAVDKGLAALAQAVAKGETVLAPVAGAAKGYTIYLVGHAHLDMNWMWSWPETVAAGIDTVTTVLKLMDEFPGFHFSQSQASIYRLLEEHRPDLLDQIAVRVAEGRWEVTASHWVEGDKNLASAESLCRHLLYSRRYMQQLFGLSPEEVPIDWAPDTFGHAHTAPSYLVRGAVKYAYMHRPGVQTDPKPEAFWWQSPEGARVLVRNDMRRGYNGVVTPQIVNDLLVFVRETGLPFTMFVYGVGDHGGGPTRRDLARAVDLASWPVFPRLEMSTAKTFYERLEAEGTNLPLLDCELNTEFTGCYTTQSLIKKCNRFAEHKLCAAETFAALAAAALGHPCPATALEQGWRNTLFSQFHDILPGSGVRDTRTYCHGLYQQTVAATGAAETAALRALAAAIDTSTGADETTDLPAARVARTLGAGVGFGTNEGALSAATHGRGQGRHPFVIFNPTAWQRDEIIEAVVWDAGAWGFDQQNPGQLAYAVQWPDGNLTAAQLVEHGNYWGHEFVRLAFPATVGASGYAACAILEDQPAPVEAATRHVGLTHHCPYSQYERSPEGLENEHLRLELDPVTGGLRSLVHRASGTEVIDTAEGSALLEYAVERPHGMTAWLVDHTGPTKAPRVTGLRRKLNGPYRVSLEVDFALHASTFTLTYELRAGDPRLHLHLQGTWFERGTRETGIPSLRLRLPTALGDAKGCYEIPFGALERDCAHGEEVPALRWAAVTGTRDQQPFGCVLFNDCKHGHSLNKGTLRLTLLRSSYDPDPLPEIDHHEVRLAMLPFTGPLCVADTIRAATAFDQPLRVVSTDVHHGSLPPLAELLTVAPTTLIPSALKQAEDEDSLLLRLFDPTGQAATATATFNPDFFGRCVAAEEVDLLERPVPNSSAALAGNAVTLAVPGRGLATVKVAFQR